MGQNRAGTITGRERSDPPTGNGSAIRHDRSEAEGVAVAPLPTAPGIVAGAEGESCEARPSAASREEPDRRLRRGCQNVHAIGWWKSAICQGGEPGDLRRRDSSITLCSALRSR